jgi:DNA-3-methyladenine glycosylase I
VTAPTGAVAGPDGRLRCGWALSAPEYVAYHDDEWGRTVSSDDAMFERLTLEAFQSGLSWLVILRKREGFRRAFDRFSISAVASYGPRDSERLLADASIVRNRAKIEAAVANARAALDLPGGLRRHVLTFAPAEPPAAARTLAELRSTSPESTALAKDLRKRGFRFVGPTTLYALMQATGMVDDHLVDCWRRGVSAR